MALHVFYHLSYFLNFEAFIYRPRISRSQVKACGCAVVTRDIRLIYINSSSTQC